jgi:hypothetical protein
MIRSLLENFTQSPTTSSEDENYMWRWMIKQYGKHANPIDTTDKISKFMKTQAIPLFQKMYNTFVPQLNTLKEIFQVPTNTTPTVDAISTNVQTGGGSKEFHQYRLNTYQNMMGFLQKHNINLQPITSRVIEHLFLCNYSIDNIKYLNYMLFYLNQVKDIPEKKNIQTIFDKLALDIQRTMLQ